MSCLCHLSVLQQWLWECSGFRGSPAGSHSWISCFRLASPAACSCKTPLSMQGQTKGATRARGLLGGVAEVITGANPDIQVS